MKTGQEKMKMTTGKIQAWVVAACLVIAGATAAYDVYADGDVPLGDVPAAGEGQQQECGKFLTSPSKWCWVKKVEEAVNAEDNLRAEVARLQSALDAAAGVQLNHDKQLDAARQQVDRTSKHFEEIISEMEREMHALRLQNKALDESMQDLQDKENALIWVNGCFVPKSTGLDIPTQ